jgi:uncharacterized membrane protein (DUF485 family)
MPWGRRSSRDARRSPRSATPHTEASHPPAARVATGGAQRHPGAPTLGLDPEQRCPGRPQEVAVSVEARPGADDPYVALQETDEFQDLRRKFRGFVFPMTAFFLTWYFLYVLLSIFAPGFMNKPISGLVTVGLVFGLLQFVTTFAITFIYARWASRTFDPAAEALGAQMDAMSAPKGDKS